jgi:hypothetical protein
MSFVAISLCVASQRVFVAVYFMTESGNFWIRPRIMNEELHSLYASPDIRVIRLGGMRLAGHEALMG